MYERSAIVLERYVEKILKFDKQYNLKDNYNNFKELTQELENYQIITTKEGKIIQEFDDTVKKLESIQKEQEKIYRNNIKLEEERNKLFNDLDEDALVLENKFIKIEVAIEKNNEQLKSLRIEYIKLVSEFTQRQKERNKCEKERRLSETNHIESVKKYINEFSNIDINDILGMKQIINSEKEKTKQEITDIMVKNGKNEKVAFNQEVLKMAIETRMNIAEREVNCYISIYDKMRKILAEIDNDNLKLDKYKKALRDVSVKLAFLRAEKEYIVAFLDYERMTAISGTKIHKKMMEEACKNFELDMAQINNLYELILREISNKATKKAYRELYNKTYLRNIEDKEKNFEQEVNNIKINMGTVINSNYWRIEGIKNIYDVFQEEITEKFEKDLSEFREEIEEPVVVEEHNDEIELLHKKDEKQQKTESVIEDKDKKLKQFQEIDLDEFDFDDEEEFLDDEYEDDDEEELEEEYDDEYDEEDDDADFLDDSDDEDIDSDIEDFEDDEDEDGFEDEIEQDEETEENFEIEDDDIEEDAEEDNEDEDFLEEDDNSEDESFFEKDDDVIDDDFFEEDDEDKIEKPKALKKKNIKTKQKNKKDIKKDIKVEKKETKSNRGLFDKIFKDKKEKSKKI